MNHLSFHSAVEAPASLLRWWHKDSMPHQQQRSEPAAPRLLASAQPPDPQRVAPLLAADCKATE